MVYLAAGSVQLFKSVILHLYRVFFLIGMYLCVFAAMFGCKFDPSRYILGHWIFSPLAKVSFCLYLTHFIVIMSGNFQIEWVFFGNLHHPCILLSLIYFGDLFSQHVYLC